MNKKVAMVRITEDIKTTLTKLLLSTTELPNYGSHFAEPIDPNNQEFTDYYQIIEQPMDLATLQNQLQFNEYECIYQLLIDFKLIFQNSQKYHFGKKTEKQYLVAAQECENCFVNLFSECRGLVFNRTIYDEVLQNAKEYKKMKPDEVQKEFPVEIVRMLPLRISKLQLEDKMKILEVLGYQKINEEINIRFHHGYNIDLIHQADQLLNEMEQTI